MKLNSMRGTFGIEVGAWLALTRPSAPSGRTKTPGREPGALPPASHPRRLQRLKIREKVDLVGFH
jgi:hypothetical protein